MATSESRKLLEAQFGRRECTLVQCPNDGGILCIGGYVSRRDPCHSMLKSLDRGVSFFQLHSEVPFGRRITPSCGISCGALILVGGVDDTLSAPHEDVSFVWASVDDGLSWSRRGTIPEWAGATVLYSSCCSDGTNMYVCGGLFRSMSYDAMFHTCDGGVTFIRHQLPFGRRFGLGSHIFRDELVLCGGCSNGTFYQDVWKSSDRGRTWQCATSAAPWSGRYFHLLTSTSTHLVVMGGSTHPKRKQGCNDIWISANASDWVLFPIALPRVMFSMFVVENPFVVIRYDSSNDSGQHLQSWQQWGTEDSVLSTWKRLEDHSKRTTNKKE
jgi:hypothetical protein